MFKLLFCLFLIFKQSHGTLSDENFLSKFLFETQTNFINHQTCTLDIDCTSGFFCKNFDCVAKKQDGDLCLSGRDEECQCGRCVTDKQSWNQICYNDHECENEGKTIYNTCQSNSDCPVNFYCNNLEGNLCMSKLNSGRMCNSDDECSCGRCSQVKQVTRLNWPAIVYHVCSC